MKKIVLLYVFLVMGISSFGQVNFTLEIRADGHGIAVADELSESDFSWSMKNLNTGFVITDDDARFKWVLHDGYNMQGLMVDIDEFSVSHGGLHVGDYIEFAINITSGKYVGYSGCVVCHYARAGSADFFGDDGINVTLSSALNIICCLSPCKIDINNFGVFVKADDLFLVSK